MDPFELKFSINKVVKEQFLQCMQYEMNNIQNIWKLQHSTIVRDFLFKNIIINPHAELCSK